MKTFITTLFCFYTMIGLSQSVIGKWKTIDDETGKEKAIVEIFEANGKIYGKIIEILEPEKKKLKCEKCEGSDKNKPILGLTIIKGLTKNGEVYDGNNIIDPKNGKSYRCKMYLENKDKLIVRGYIGISFFGRSQVWHRFKS